MAAWRPVPIATQFCVFLLLTASLSTAAEPQWERFRRTERHMGADFTVMFYATDRERADHAFTAAFDIVKRIDARASDYTGDSELAKLGQSSPTSEPIGVSDDLWSIFVAAQEVSQKSNGQFDITIGPLTKLWRRAKRQKELPTVEEIAAAKESIGWRSLVLHAETKSVELKLPKMRLDVGGIAPGYATDCVLEELARRGITRALVDASGDVRLGDPPPNAKGWVIGFAPLTGDGEPERFALLSHCAVSTSGDAYRGVAINGTRYSHIVDPQDGKGLRRRASVNVIAPLSITADALATTLSITGPDKGQALLSDFPGVEAYWELEQAAGMIDRRSTPGFNRHLISSDEALRIIASQKEE